MGGFAVLEEWAGAQAAPGDPRPRPRLRGEVALSGVNE